jgi:GT2 family glycosyltransferase
VIVCFRDRPDLLRRAVTSLLDVTQWERLRVRLVDNGSESPATARLVEELARDERVVATSDPRPFNFGAINNAAAAASDADVLAFVNSDTEAIDPGWLEALLEHAVRPEVGAVAPLLVRPDGRVQHAGAALGLHGYAGHPFAGLRPDHDTPFGTAADGTRNWLAVTAACLVIERAKFAAVGGFDDGFTVAGQDVDLGLRLTASGRRSLCVAHTRVVHDESASRDPKDIPEGDFARSRERYGAFRTAGDPFYSPALTLAATDCALRSRGEEILA